MLFNLQLKSCDHLLCQRSKQVCESLRKKPPSLKHLKISKFKFRVRLRPYSSEEKFKLHLPPVLGWSKVVFSKGPENEMGRLGGNYRKEEKNCDYSTFFSSQSHSTINFSNPTMIFTVCCLAQGSVFKSVNEIGNPLV